MTDTPQLSDLQLAVMRALWESGEATAADVHAALAGAGRALAPTTVSTLLTRLEKRGLVTHRREGRQYVFAAAVAEHAVRRQVVERVTEQFFEGDVTALVSHLLKRSELSPSDLDEVRSLIAAADDEEEERDP